MTRLKLHAALLLGSATLLLSSGAFAQSDTTPTTTSPKHRHHHDGASGSDRFDLLERQLQQQADQIKQQAGEIQALKTQVGMAPTPAPTQVTAEQFQALQNQVHEQTMAQKKQAVVAFAPQTPYQHQKSQPTISSADGKWSFSPIVLAQGDWADFSKSQPLSTPGTNNLKSSGENIRRAWIGFQGTIDGDFGYRFVYDFGGSNGNETYQGYAAANSLTTTNSGGKNTTPYSASTGTGTGAHVQSAWLSYRGILNPFTFKVGVMSTPANLGDTTQSDDLLFSERPSPAQLSRALDADEGRESVGIHWQWQHLERFAVSYRRHLWQGRAGSSRDYQRRRSRSSRRQDGHRALARPRHQFQCPSRR